MDKLQFILPHTTTKHGVPPDAPFHVPPSLGATGQTPRPHHKFKDAQLLQLQRRHPHLPKNRHQGTYTFPTIDQIAGHGTDVNPTTTHVGAFLPKISDVAVPLTTFSGCAFFCIGQHTYD